MKITTSLMLLLLGITLWLFAIVIINAATECQEHGGTAGRFGTCHEAAR